MLTKVKFIDGPLAGFETSLPDDPDYIYIGRRGAQLWTYSYAGKENRVRLYGKVHASRHVMKAVMAYIAATGKDPRVLASQTKATPAKRTSPPAQGRGRRRRAMKANRAT